MKRKAVESSLLTSIGYDKKTKTLEVQFTHGDVYQYFDVPEREYKALIHAESIGRYFNFNIRGLIHTYSARPSGVLHHSHIWPLCGHVY